MHWVGTVRAPSTCAHMQVSAFPLLAWPGRIRTPASLWHHYFLHTPTPTHTCQGLLASTGEPVPLQGSSHVASSHKTVPNEKTSYAKPAAAGTTVKAVLPVTSDQLRKLAKVGHQSAQCS